MKICLNAIVCIMRAFLSPPACVWVCVCVQAKWINCAMHFCSDENHKMASTLVTPNANVVRTQLRIENAAFLFIVFIIMNASIFAACWLLLGWTEYCAVRLCFDGYIGTMAADCFHAVHPSTECIYNIICYVMKWKG